MFCPTCGAGNLDTAQFCVECGNKLQAVASPFSASNSTAKAPAGYSNKDFYEAFVGDKNQHYYIEKFLQFDRDGKTSLSWHWPAFFVTFYWLLYRKMWLNAFLYMISPYVVAIILTIITVALGTVGAAIAGLGYFIFLLALFILPPLYANTWYYKQAKQKIADTAVFANNPQKRFGILAGRGGTSGIIIILIMVFGLISLIGILAAISIPAYQDYVTKSKTVQAVAIGNRATNSIDSYFQKYHRAPASLAEAGFQKDLPPNIRDIAFSDQTGLLTITLNGNQVNTQKVIFSPEVNGNEIIWRCSGENLKATQLPKQCQ